MLRTRRRGCHGSRGSVCGGVGDTADSWGVMVAGAVGLPAGCFEFPAVDEIDFKKMAVVRAKIDAIDFKKMAVARAQIDAMDFNKVVLTRAQNNAMDFKKMAVASVQIDSMDFKKMVVAHAQIDAMDFKKMAAESYPHMRRLRGGFLEVELVGCGGFGAARRQINGARRNTT